jgi:hypothetical protein
MITTTLRFTGNSAQGAEIYRSYYLLADDIGNGGGKSSVIPMSAQAVMPDADHYSVKSGGAKAALDLVIKVLAELPGNQGLSIDINLAPT